MPRHPSEEPTAVELEILRVLWETGGATAREVHEARQDQRPTNYSTTVKMLAVMRDKGLVVCDSGRRPQRFTAAQARGPTRQRMLERMIERVYDGSAKSVVLEALSGGPTSREDLDEIRALLDRLEEESA